jgi:asparagine synthase (glutamine-hydrolysing)
MSGIYGVYRYDGAPVDSRWLELMKEAMAYYGPDGSSCQIDGPVGMGHLLLKIAPEDAFDRQPVRGERGLVVSTARLDNRDALLDIFDVASEEAPRISDGSLVALAFDRWGEDLCSHLEGDWALAAWEPRERRLYLGRDVFGSAGLYYYEGKGFIAFASNLNALLALPGTVKEPDMLRLAEILALWEHDAELTAYKGFRSLLGAHVMTISAAGETRDRRFWSLGEREPLRYRRDDEYVEAFLEHYARAVQSCLRTEKPVAAELSGGRDSGSIVALAGLMLARQGRDLTAYTWVPQCSLDGAGWERYLSNEWERAAATAAMVGANIRHLPIDGRAYKILESLEYLLDVHSGPFAGAYSGYLVRATLEAASRNGCGVLLNGGWGNASVSWQGNGSAILALLQGHPATAGRLLLHADPNLWQTLKRQVAKPLLLPGVLALQRLTGRTGLPSWRTCSALNHQMAEELDLPGRMHAAGYDPTFAFSPLNDHRRCFFQFERGTASSLRSEGCAFHSFASPDPTTNLSLLEFLLRVPDDQFYRKGERGFLFKRAFQGRLPQPVLDSRKNVIQAADSGHRVLQEIEEVRECLRSLDAVPGAQEILDLPLLHSCLEDLVAEVTPETTLRADAILLRGLSVGLFLRRLASSPA